MIKLNITFPITLLIILFFLSPSFSNARISLDLPENNVKSREIPNPLPKNVDPTIRLPSDVNPVNGKPKMSVPLRFVNLRPSNPTFRPRPSMPFRHCHHHHHHYHHNFRPVGDRGQELPFDNDMIYSISENSVSNLKFFENEAQEIQPTLHYHHHHHHHHDEEGNEVSRFSAEKYKGRHFHYEEEEKEKALKQEDEKQKNTGEDEEEEEEEGGFLLNFRKFLNQFEI